MALDRRCSNEAYLIGRLLAVLRAAEIKAAGETPERLSTEEKMEQLMESPKIIFGLLMSYTHITDGLEADALDAEMREIIEKLPAVGLQSERLTPEERTTAMVGYWHERSELG